MLEFGRNIIRVNVAVAWYQRSAPVVFHQCEKYAPLVLYPYRIEVLKACSDSEHYLRGIERGKYVRLVILAKNILKCYPRKENLVAFRGQFVVDVLRQYGVLCALAALGGLLIAYEDIKRLLVPRYFEDTLLQTVYLSRLGAVDSEYGAVGTGTGTFKIRVLENTVKRCSAAGREFFACCGVVDVFNAEFA